jgi:predicted MPP superfamily phosphohydrolase
MFESILLAVAAIGHAVLWVALVNRAHGLGIKRRWVTLITLAFIAMFGIMPLIVLVALISATNAEPSQNARLFYAAAWIYIASCAVVCIVSTVQRLRWRWHAERKGALVSNHTKQVHLPSVVAEPLMSSTANWLSRLPGNQVLSLCIQEKQITLPRLKAADARIRIAHLSDLHMSGRMTRAFYEYVVQETNRCQPDIIAITGDLVDTDACIPWIVEILSQLKAPGGVYYVLGNHDLRVSQGKLQRALKDSSLSYVGDEPRLLKINGIDLIIGGNELPWMGTPADFSSFPEHDAAGLPVRVALTHAPDQFRWAVANDIDLLLAGHVHGGQVCLPILGPFTAPSAHGVRYAAGIFRAGNTVMHVSRGTASLTPLRWNCPPEIAILTLTPESAKTV